MKRDKLQTDQHLEKMIDNWKLREGPSNSILLLNGLVHLEVNWSVESTPAVGVGGFQIHGLVH